MTTSKKDLLLAILSMDAYNQGYNRGIEHGKTQIGAAKFLSDSAILDSAGNVNVAQSAGFYAVSYDSTEYGTVISYRGTDNTVISYRGTDNRSDLWDLLEITPIGKLVLTDIPIALRDDFDEPSIHLASKFYQSVNGTLNDTNNDQDPEAPEAPNPPPWHSRQHLCLGGNPYSREFQQ